MTYSGETEQSLAVLVNGAGPAGLLMARVLRTQGVHVTLIEKKSALGSDGAGIALPASALQGFTALDTLLPTEQQLKQKILDKAHRVHDIVFTDQQGHSLSQQSLNAHPFNADAFVALTRSDLMAILVNGLEDTIQFRTWIKKVTHNDTHKICVQLNNGQIEHYDLVVDASGINSTLRQSPQVNHGVINWRTVIPFDTSNIAPTYMLGANNKLFLIYPCGPQKLYIYAHALEADLTNENITLNQFKQLFANFGGYVPAVLDKITNIEQLYQGHLQSQSSVILQDNRIVLTGDAAAGCTPGLQGGMIKATLCAYTLGKLLQEREKHSGKDRINQVITNYRLILQPVLTEIIKRSDRVVTIANLRWHPILNPLLGIIKRLMIKWRGPLNTQGWRALLQSNESPIERINRMAAQGWEE